MGIAVDHYIRGLDVREAPMYHFAEAARYLRMNEARLRNWFVITIPLETVSGAGPKPS
jgi:hypothetical protein